MQRKKRLLRNDISRSDGINSATDKKKKASKQSATPSDVILLKNCFNVLENEGEEHMEDSSIEDSQPSVQANYDQDKSTKNSQSKSITEKGGNSQEKSGSFYNHVETNTKTERIPLITIQDKTVWDHTAGQFKSKKINFSHAKNTNNGIIIQITDVDSHKAAPTLLRELNVDYYTLSMKDEAELRVVIKRILEHYKEEDIKEDLEEQGFHPEDLYRIKTERRPLPLVLAILPRDEKEIFTIKAVKHFLV